MAVDSETYMAVCEQVSRLQAENEALRARLAVQFDALTSIAVALKGAGNLTKEMHDFIVAATDGDSEAILLRKQAEAVEDAHKSTVLTTKGDHPYYERGFDDAMEQFDAQMDRAVAALRQQADEAEPAGGEK